METKFWRGAAVLASIVAGMGAADAADLAVKAPVYKAPVILSDWAGLYVGLAGGYGFGDMSFDADPVLDGKPKGGLFGGYAGYNWQYGSWVLGVESDFSVADLKASPVPGLTEKTDELASSRVRVGYIVLPCLLAYGTAGAGYGHSEISEPAGRGGGVTSIDINQFGWVAGAGLEYKVWGNFIARAEYLHYDFNKTSVVPGLNVSETVDVVRGGLSYKF
jgi:outer membrane immunogenic protein